MKMLQGQMKDRGFCCAAMRAKREP